MPGRDLPLLVARAYASAFGLTLATVRARHIPLHMVLWLAEMSDAELAAFPEPLRA